VKILDNITNKEEHQRTPVYDMEDNVQTIFCTVPRMPTVIGSEDEVLQSCFSPVVAILKAKSINDCFATEGLYRVPRRFTYCSSPRKKLNLTIS
jgi:hypothetical protein